MNHQLSTNTRDFAWAVIWRRGTVYTGTKSAAEVFGASPAGGNRVLPPDGKLTLMRANANDRETTSTTLPLDIHPLAYQIRRMPDQNARCVFGRTRVANLECRFIGDCRRRYGLDAPSRLEAAAPLRPLRLAVHT